MPILSWLTRDDDVRAAQRVPSCLLEEVPALSAGDPAAGNMLIQRGIGISLQFEKPKSSQITVKVINHLGDEVMVFRVNE